MIAFSFMTVLRFLARQKVGTMISQEGIIVNAFFVFFV